MALIASGMDQGEGIHAILNGAGLKVHPKTGVVGRIVRLIECSGFSDCRVVLELADGTERKFLLHELRDATGAEQAKYAVEVK